MSGIEQPLKVDWDGMRNLAVEVAEERRKCIFCKEEFDSSSTAITHVKNHVLPKGIQ